jgi:hypothetical protein
VKTNETISTSFLWKASDLKGVAKRYNASCIPVRNVRKKYYPGLSQPQTGRSGTPSNRDCCQLVRMVTPDPLGSSAIAAKRFKTSTSVRANESTARNALHEAGLMVVGKDSSIFISQTSKKNNTSLSNTIRTGQPRTGGRLSGQMR